MTEQPEIAKAVARRLRWSVAAVTLPLKGALALGTTFLHAATHSVAQIDWTPFGKDAEPQARLSVAQRADRTAVHGLLAVQRRNVELRRLWTQRQRQQHMAFVHLVGVLIFAAVWTAAADVAGAVPAPPGAVRSLSGTVAFMAIEPVGDAIQVSVIQRVTAAAGPAAAGGTAGRLAIPLPEVAPVPRNTTPVNFVSGWRRPQIRNGMITDSLLPPAGAAEMAYVFAFQPRGAAATLRWILPYGAADVELLVSEGGLKASGTDLRARGVVTERGRHYVRWSAGPVQPGQAIVVRLDGSRASEGRWPEVAAGVLAVTLACGLTLSARGPGRRGEPVG